MLWIGQTAFFSWLDARMRVEADAEGAEVWMVHSGGLYRVEKHAAPRRMPRQLHWFKWEAATSWVSGLSLLVLVYYLGGGMSEPGGALGEGQQIGLGLATLVLAWPVYDLAAKRLERAGATAGLLGLAAIAALAWGLDRGMSGRAAYLHVGATLGTLMAANVWMRILPAQRRMVSAIEGGSAPDPALAERAKRRSGHNTFLALPVIFIMISSHFPATYGSRLAWLLLAGLTLVGFIARRGMNAWNERLQPSPPPA